MEKNPSNITRICLVAFGASIVLSSLFFLHSTHAAVSTFLGSILMIANVWMLARALFGVMFHEHPNIGRTIFWVVTKVVGLFALSWVFLRYLGVHPLWFGASATSTIVIMALALSVRTHREALS